MIRVAILGAGHLGKIHLKLLQNLSEFEIAGFYDNDAETLQKVSAEFGVKGFTNADELIGSSDAIDIVTPTPFHYEYASAAIKAGKHVFIEKPVTGGYALAKKLLTLANEANIVAHAGYVERFNPAFTAARPKIDRPLFIDCRRIATWNPRGTDVSVILDLMVHDIDLVLNLVRSPVRKILATGAPVLCPTEDIAEARIEFDNGCVATLSTSRVATHNLRKLTVFQKQNYFSVDLLEKSASESYAATDATGARFVQHDKLAVQPVNAIEHELKMFAQAIKKQKTEAVTLDEACNTLKVAEQILETIRRNRS